VFVRVNLVPPDQGGGHALLDLRGSIQTFIHISDGKVNDVNVIDRCLVIARQLALNQCS